MKVLIEIDEEVYKKAKETHDVMCDSVWLGIKYGTPLNGTNGDVLKAVFPNMIIVEDTEHDCLSISNDFWNADYKGVE